MTQGIEVPVPMCNRACLTAIEKKTSVEASPEAEPADSMVSTAFPFRNLQVSPASLCPDVCKAGQADATAIEQCNEKCVAASSSLSDDDDDASGSAPANSTSPTPAGDAPAVSGSFKVTYGLATMCAAILLALF